MLMSLLITDFLVGASETFISVAIIGALFTGGTALIKAIFGKNENKALEYQHQERLIELMSKSNDNSERLINSVDKLSNEVKEIRTQMNDFNERLNKLENK